MTTFTGTPVSSAGQTGRYTNETNLNNKFGSENIRLWSQVNNSVTTKDSDRILAALNQADSVIDDALRNGRYLVPLQPINVTYGVVERIATIYAGFYLYEARGFDDESTEEQNKLSLLKTEADNLLKKIQSSQIHLNCVGIKRPSPTGPFIA